jgi:hypothetical protein
MTATRPVALWIGGYPGALAGMGLTALVGTAIAWFVVFDAELRTRIANIARKLRSYA